MPKFELLITWQSAAVIEAQNKDDALDIWMNMSYPECLEAMRAGGIDEEIDGVLQQV